MSLLIIMAAMPSNAQVTIGATPYANLTAAFNAINAGTHTGAIVVNINANTTETVTATLNSSGTGAANYTSVLVQPTANVIVTGNIVGALVRLNGADNVTIDGLLSGTRQLTFNNTAASSSSAVIWVSSASSTNGATGNTIRNCNINGASLTTTLAGIGSSGTTLGAVAEAANNNNTYENNVITTAQYGIAIVGPTGNETGLVIRGNTIGSTVPANKIWFRGIFVAQEQNMLITQNRILGVNFTSGSGANQGSGIYVGGTISGGLIERNEISDIRVLSVWGCNGIQLNSSSANTGLTVANNFIYDIVAGGFGSFNSVDDNGTGIAINTGGGYSVVYNSINLNTNQTSGITAAIFISNSTTISNIELVNNIFANSQTNNTRYSIINYAPVSAFSTINYNDYYTTGSSIGNQAGTVIGTLAAWQTNTGQDGNSVALNPSFFSGTDLHLFFNSPLDGLGTPLGGVTNDFDNDVRDGSTPDIGADEFTPPNCTTNNGGTASISITDVCASGTATLSATGYSFGFGIAYQWEFFNGSWQPLPGQTNPASASTGLISATTQFRLRVTCNAGAPGYSTVVTLTVNDPTVTSTTPGSRCGVGTVNLSATGSNIKWYDVPTGGTAIGTGPAFTTPTISSTTTFYVSASTAGTNVNGGKTGTTGPNGGYTGVAGLAFDATAPFTILSVKMYPQGNTQVTIQAQDNTGTPLPGCTLNYTFTGATTTGEIVPLNFPIPIGTGHRLMVTANTNSVQIWRDFSGNTYPYTLGAFGAITGGRLGASASTTYYFFYDWLISNACEGNRVPVTATVTAPPNINPSASPTTICSGASTNLNVTSANAGYTYVWTPGSLSGAAQTVTPASTTTYVVTATDASAGPFNGCVDVDSVTINVNFTPTTLTVNPAVSNICTGVPLQLTTSGGVIPGVTAFTETFETFPLTQFSTQVLAGSMTVSQNTTYYSQGTSSVHLVPGNSTNAGIQSSVINLTNFTSPTLTFSHICGMESSTSAFDFGYIEYSTNGGTTYTPFPTSSYTGSGTLFNGVVSFSTRSYTDWITTLNAAAATPGAGPATALWKTESINLTPWQGNANFRIRFRFTTDVSLLYYGWLIDNVRITGTGPAPVTWTGVPNTELFISVGPNVAYTGQQTPTVWTIPTVNHIYTATAAGGGGCNTTATSDLTVSSATVGVSITASPSSTICAGTSVTFTATGTNGGTNPFYQWFVNGSGPVASGIGLDTYTTSTLANGDVVTCTLLSNLPGGPGCVLNNPATSNAINMTVNPNPTVNITGANTVCNGAPPTVLTANASVTPGSIASYEWFIGGVSQGAPSGVSTFNATTAGSYTVEVLSAAGCPQTSVAFDVTLPTYNIIATAGANGSISPSGTVTVNCGDNITFTITPNPFYSIQDVIVDGSSVGPVGTYTFTNVTGPHTINATFFISGCPTPPTANAGANAEFCANASYTLNGVVGGSATAGTWSGGGGTFAPNNTTLNATYTPSAAEISAGFVTLTLTSNNPAGAPCVASTSTVTLTIKEIPSVNITGTLGFCPSSSTILTANASINPAGPLTYAWTRGVTPLGTSSTQSATIAGAYTVAVTGNGCTNTATVNVIQYVAPTISISGSNVICTNSNTDLNADVVVGSAPITATNYQWRRNGVDIPGATTGLLSTSIPGNYTVVVTDDNGCISAESAIHVLGPDTSPLNGIYTISTAPASCTNYTSFASAINDLNTRAISGDVRFLVDPGFTETAPTGGLALGSVALNASVSGRTISFEKSGVGANPLISAYTGGTGSPSTATPDGIWSIRGTDNVTISEIDLFDGNTTNNATMEYGYGLFKLSATDGVQNTTITGCTITLNRVNNTAAIAPMVEGSVGILVINATATAAITALTPTAASGTNSNNKFYSNTIQNCNHGISLSGYAAASPFTLGDTNNDVGGTSALTGNSILNYGGGGATQSAGIRAQNQWGLNVSFNTINNNDGAGVNHNGPLRGIYAQSGTSASVNINNNTITLTSGTTGGSACTPIENAIGSTAAANTVNINDNTITASLPSATTANFVAISQTATAANVNVNGNIIQNCSLPGSGSWTGILNSSATGTISLVGNDIINNTIASTGLFIGITNTTGGTISSLSINNNVISNNTKNINAGTHNIINTSGVAGANMTVNGNIITDNTFNTTIAAGNIILNAINGGTSTYTYDGNIVSNISIAGLAGNATTTFRGIANVSGATNETISNNQVSRMFVTGTTTGIATIIGIISNAGAASVKNIFNNRVDTLYSGSAVNSNITGIQSTTGATIGIYRNKIGHLVGGGSNTANIVRGIHLSSTAAGGTANIHNNMVNIDMAQAFAPSANNVLTGANAVRGISNESGTSGTINIYYNTVRINGGGSGTAFGSSAMSNTSTSNNVSFINNIFVNLANPGGGAGSVSAALRRGSAALATYISTSNNNNLYAGTPGATRVLYYDGATGYQTLAAMAGIAGFNPRENASVSVNPVFVSNTDLHLNPAANCDLDGAGKPIAGIEYQNDIDGDIRDTNAPDIGADEHTGTGGSGVWKGYNTDWNDPINWCGVVPTASTNVVIPSGKTNYPLITLNNALCNNITISGGASVLLTGVGKLAIHGSITNSGTFDATDGTIEMAGAAAQTIPATTFLGDNVKNLIISNSSVTLGGDLNLLNKLSFIGNNRTFATAGFLTLKSTASRTASVTDITNNSTNTGNSITGDVTVERFASARRAWRLLSVPNQNNLQTIKESWQENQVANSTTPAGFGIQIPSNRASWAGDGFDIYTPNGGPSVKTYNPATNDWVGIISTVPVVAPTPNNGRHVTGTAYMTLVRGDRTVNTFPSAATTTVLRAKGALVTGNFGPVAVGAGQFAAIGNPYASAVDFTKLTKSNLQDVYYLWDPQLGTLGGYQTFLGPTYTAVPGGGSYASGNKLIESGSGFFVRAPGVAGSLTFTEPSKGDTNNLVQRITGPQQYIRTNLKQAGANGTVLFDGVMNRFDENYNNQVDDEDFVKLGNFGESLGLARNGQLLVAESRKPLQATDTIFYQLGQVRAQAYAFEFIPENMQNAGVEAFLEDTYLNTKTPVSLFAPSSIPFTVVNEPGSYSPNRFRMVFKLMAPVPVSFTNVRAEKANEDILVSWKVENELAIDHYSVEKSADGRLFSEIGERIATGNQGSTVQYNWLDRDVINGMNYYRIRSLGLNGEVKYSEVVKLNVRDNSPSLISVYPNPVREDGMVQVSMNNVQAGNYVISLYNELGQVTYRRQQAHAGGNAVYTINLGKELSHGQYTLEVKGTDNSKTTFNLIY